MFEVCHGVQSIEHLICFICEADIIIPILLSYGEAHPEKLNDMSDLLHVQWLVSGRARPSLLHPPSEVTHPVGVLFCFFNP